MSVETYTYFVPHYKEYNIECSRLYMIDTIDLLRVTVCSFSLEMVKTSVGQIRDSHGH
jgi:hypothetical protein